ncbi:ComF family protein [Stenotrophomonas sp. PS02298]|uniref:ComF family protein n=1 Tax=Stenotrophomonas sp. PS02298 TaxID=2991424 RepID=UPI002499C2F8|nr:ComF family protein [Stenotrophomonas sp. PS02298]
MKSLVYRVGGRLSALLFPPRCLVCGEDGMPGRDLCLACGAGLPWQHAACRRCALPLPASDADGLCGACQRSRSPLQAVQAAFTYNAPIDGLLRRFKFHHDLSAGRLLSALMLDALGAAERPQAIVPVPLHLSRLRQRGYDQTWELAKPLARALQLPLCRGLHRRRSTQPQSELDAVERKRNLRGAFIAVGQLPAHVVLLDDVMTTGATLHAAALTLHRAGVQRVDAWVCARVP